MGAEKQMTLSIYSKPEKFLECKVDVRWRVLTLFPPTWAKGKELWSGRGSGGPDKDGGRKEVVGETNKQRDRIGCEAEMRGGEEMTVEVEGWCLHKLSDNLGAMILCLSLVNDLFGWFIFLSDIKQTQHMYVCVRVCGQVSLWVATPIHSRMIRLCGQAGH